MLLNAAKCQGYSFYHFLVIKGKPTGVVNLLPTTHPPRLGLNPVKCYDLRNAFNTVAVVRNAMILLQCLLQG